MLRAVSRLPEDLLAAILERPPQALTHHDVVVADDHSHSPRLFRLAHGGSMHPRRRADSRHPAAPELARDGRASALKARAPTIHTNVATAGAERDVRTS